MRRSPFLVLGSLVLCLSVLGQSAGPQLSLPANEPANLNDLQALVTSDPKWFPDDQPRLDADQARLAAYEKKLIAYHDCTDPAFCYTTDIEKQTDKAISYLEQRVQQRKEGEKLAIVLDIDETSLSNWELERRDQFNYVSADWSAWYVAAKAPAISGTMKLFEKAIDNQVDVFFVTGRAVADAAVTEKDLLKAKYLDKEKKERGWKYLYTRPDAIGTVAEYKSRMRADIETGTWKEHIILNVGDQLSDLNGSPRAELSVKLPNPFYFIP